MCCGAKSTARNKANMDQHRRQHDHCAKGSSDFVVRVTTSRKNKHVLTIPHSLHKNTQHQTPGTETPHSLHTKHTTPNTLDRHRDNTHRQTKHPRLSFVFIVYTVSFSLRATRFLERYLLSVSLSCSNCCISFSCRLLLFRSLLFELFHFLVSGRERRQLRWNWVRPPWRRRLPSEKTISFSYASTTLQSRWCSHCALPESTEIMSTHFAFGSTPSPKLYHIGHCCSSWNLEAKPTKMDNSDCPCKCCSASFQLQPSAEPFYSGVMRGTRRQWWRHVHWSFRPAFRRRFDQSWSHDSSSWRPVPSHAYPVLLAHGFKVSLLAAIIRSLLLAACC